MEQIGVESRWSVMDKHRQSVDIQDDNQKILYGKEYQHLVYNVKVYHNSESDHQERSILDE